MSTVLVIEDEFLAGYELECLLKDNGYNVRHVATTRDAISVVDALSLSGDLVAVVCDNRLIKGEPAAAFLYRAIRARRLDMPFIVYSGCPPDLPRGDSYLKVVRKPFADRVVSQVRALAPLLAKSRSTRAPLRRREAA